MNQNTRDALYMDLRAVVQGAQTVEQDADQADAAILQPIIAAQLAVAVQIVMALTGSMQSAAPMKPDASHPAAPAARAK